MDFYLKLIDLCLIVVDADGDRERIQNQDEGERYTYAHDIDKEPCDGTADVLHTIAVASIRRQMRA